MYYLLVYMGGNLTSCLALGTLTEHKVWSIISDNKIQIAVHHQLHNLSEKSSISGFTWML